MHPTGDSPIDLSTADWGAFQSLIERFEGAWRNLPRPDIDDYLPAHEGERATVLLELVHADLEFRLKAGESARVEEYLRRYPELSADRGALLELILVEYDLRRRDEPRLALDEFAARFPELGDALRAEPQGRWAAQSHPTIAGDLVPSEDPIRLAPSVTSEEEHPGAGTAVQPPRLGRFEILEAIGRGAFGVVYRAWDPDLGRVVALKVPRSGGLAEPTEVERFLREARGAARLRHSNIVAVYDTGWIGGICYLVSEYIEGTTLAERLKAGALQPLDAAEVAARVADALDHAHRQGVVHRDLKPSNILIDATGRPLVTDFGLAKLDSGEPTVTLDGQVLGTPAYMAPEQARGLGSEADARSDVYSLGVVLYQMLVGDLPFRGSSRVLLHRILYEDPRSPRAVNELIPRDLETICLKAMAKEPSKRYATAIEVADDLRRFMRRDSIRARPVGAAERLVRQARRHPRTALLAAAAVLVGVLGFAGVVWQWRRAEDAYRLAARRVGAERHAREVMQATVYRQLIALAEREISLDQFARADELLDECPPTLRGWEWYHLKRLRHAAPRPFRGHTGRVNGLAYRPDGRRFASAGVDGSLRIWNPESGREVKLLSGHSGPVLCVAFSPDGRRLASAGEDGSIRVWDPDAGSILFRLDGEHATAFGLAFRPDGSQLAAGSDDGAIRIWDASDRLVKTIRGHASRVTQVAYSPDGRLLASSSNDGTVRLWDPDTGAEMGTLPDRMRFHVTSVAFGAEGRRLASAGHDGLVKIWNTTGGPPRTFRGHGGVVLQIAFSPDGERLASAGSDGTVKLWDPDTGQETSTLCGCRGELRGVAFSPDGRRLISSSSDGQILLWDATPEAESDDDSVVFHGHVRQVRAVAYGPSGRFLVSGGDDGTVRVWDPATARELATLRGHTGGILSIAVSPDGRRIASAGWDEEVRVWDRDSNRCALVLFGHRSAVSRVAFSPDGRYLASASWDRTARTWDLSRGAETVCFREHERLVHDVVFAPDGGTVASAGNDGKVRLWEPTTGRQLHVLDADPSGVRNVAFHPDGNILASLGREGAIRRWNLATREARNGLPIELGETASMTFSPDGRVLAVAGLDQTVHLRDAADFREVGILSGYVNANQGLAFRPDGRRAALVKGDTIVEVRAMAVEPPDRTSPGTASPATAGDGTPPASGEGQIGEKTGSIGKK